MRMTVAGYFSLHSCPCSSFLVAAPAVRCLATAAVDSDSDSGFCCDPDYDCGYGRASQWRGNPFVEKHHPHLCHRHDYGHDGV